MRKISSIELEIKKIKQRNKRVEADKAWEISFFRRIVIALMTYILVVLFLWTIDIENSWLNAIVPTIGFVLSTLSLPFIKRWWINQRY
jgi:hypothetical protein